MTANSRGYVDADGHIIDKEQDYLRYLEEPYNRRFRVGGGGFDSFDRYILGTVGRPQGLNAQQWLDVLDKGGVETTVLYPTTGLGVGFIREADFAVAFCRAYNNFVSEEFVKFSPRIRAVALLPLQDPAESAKELRRAVRELKLVGGMLAADGPYLLGKPEFRPIYQEADQLGTMLAIHATGSLRGRGMDEWLFDRFIQAHTISHSYAQMRQMTSIVFEGVPEEFPNLRIAFLEAGCTWVPYWMDRMDEEYEIRGKVEAPDLSKKPSEYILGENIYVSCEPEERLLPETLKLLGDDTIVFASDYPHWDGTFPDSLFELEAREDLTQLQKAKILERNPKTLYGLA